MKLSANRTLSRTSQPNRQRSTTTSRQSTNRPGLAPIAGYTIAAGAAFAAVGSTGCVNHPARGRILEYRTPERMALENNIAPLRDIQGLEQAVLDRAFLTPDGLERWSEVNKPSLLRVDVTGGNLDVIYGGISIEKQIANGVKNPAIVLWEAGTPCKIWGSSDYLKTLGKEVMIIGYSPLGHGWSTDIDPRTGKQFNYTHDGWARSTAELLIKMRVHEILAQFPQAQIFIGGHSYGPTRLTHFLLEHGERDPVTGQLYLNLEAGRKIPVGGFISASGYHPQLNGVPQDISFMDKLTGNALIGPITWEVVKLFPKQTVGAEMGNIFGGKGGWPGGSLDQYLADWYDPDPNGLGFLKREALFDTQAGLEMAKNGAQYHQDSLPKLGVVEGLAHHFIVGKGDFVIIAKGDKEAPEGQEFEYGLRFGNPKTGETYFGRLLRDTRALTGTGELTDMQVLDGSHFPHESKPLEAATGTLEWIKRQQNPVTRGAVPQPK